MHARTSYKALRRLQLHIKLVNIVNRNLIFTWKFLSIGMCIMSGYAAIAHFRENPLFGVLYYGIFIDVALFYTIPYEKAFKVPALFDHIKSLLQVQVSRHGNGAVRKILRRQVRSIQSEGIKVGEFHTLERTSRPVFLLPWLRSVQHCQLARRVSLDLDICTQCNIWICNGFCSKFPQIFSFPGF